MCHQTLEKVSQMLPVCVLKKYYTHPRNLLLVVLDPRFTVFNLEVAARRARSDSLASALGADSERNPSSASTLLVVD